MRIIQVNKFNYLRGGSEKYFLEISRELREQGHEVALFSMKHPLNESSQWSKYFVSNVDFNKSSFWQKLIIPARVLYSLSAKKKFTKLIKDFKPDLIHCHNIYHQISPSILVAAKKQGIPVVMHLHDYKLICPNYKLFTKDKICQRCRGGKYYKCFQYKCLNDSWARSLLASLEMYLHHKILKIYKKNVDIFIAPSQFMKNACVHFGWPEEKITVLRNFHNINNEDEKPKTNNKANYLLYFGRLSTEKGIDVLLRALTKNEEELKIAGTGPDEKRLRALSHSLGLEDRVAFLGFQDGLKLQALINEAKAIIVPSVWAENMPFSVIESLANSKIVIASHSGGLAELINNKNGLLFKTGDSQDLVVKIAALNKLDTATMSEQAKTSVEYLRIDQHLKHLLAIYGKTLNK